LEGLINLSKSSGYQLYIDKISGKYCTTNAKYNAPDKQKPADHHDPQAYNKLNTINNESNVIIYKGNFFPL
jgi:hypothetical protein